MRIAYFRVVEVRKIRSRSVAQLIIETDMSKWRELAELDDQNGVFIPMELNIAEGAYELEVEAGEMQGLLKEAIGAPERPSLTGPNGSVSPAQRMFRQGYWMNRELWKAVDEAEIYTQAQHLDAVREMDPLMLYPGVANTGDVVAHHCRTAENSGTGHKPDHWFTIPITHSQHDHVHRHATRQERNEHLEMAVKLTAHCIADRVKEFLGRESWSGITNAEMAEFEERIGIHTGWWGKPE